MKPPETIFATPQADGSFSIVGARATQDDIAYAIKPVKLSCIDQPPDSDGAFLVSMELSGERWHSGAYTKSNNSWGRGGFIDFPVWYCALLLPEGAKSFLEGRMYDTFPTVDKRF